MIGQLGTTADPVGLIPGSFATLFTDAQDLRARGREVLEEHGGPVSRSVASWTGMTAVKYDARRANLAKALTGVAEVFGIAAAVLEAHAEVLRWAQGRAALAIELWAAGVAKAAAAGVPTLTLRPQTTGPFGQQPAFPEADPGAILRRSAEHVLAMAQREVRGSATAAAQILDQMSDGLPDGSFHIEEFVAGIGDWVAGFGEMAWKFHPIQWVTDPAGTVGNVGDTLGGAWDGFVFLTDDPVHAFPVLADLDTLNDNPGRWWGRLTPDIALLLAPAAGAAAKSEWLARLLGRGASDTADLARVVDGLPGAEGGGRAPGVPPEYDGLPVRHETSGQQGAWNQGLYRPDPNTVYLVDGRHVYVTDEAGLVTHTESTLTYRPQEVADVFRNKYQQTIAGGADRHPGDQGGHVIASTLGGPGEPINLVPMERALNQQGVGSFGSLEEEWRSILRSDPAARVDVSIDIDYPPGSARPSEITVQYSVDGGANEIRIFEQ